MRAPEQQDSLLNDITEAELLLRNVAATLQDCDQRSKLPGPESERVCSKLQEARDQLVDLQKAVEFLKPSGGHRLKRSALWTLAKGKIERCRGRLEAVLEDLRQSLGQYKTYCLLRATSHFWY